MTTYPQCSDCQIAWIHGDDAVWLYNPLAHPWRGPAVLLRISARTGAVLERWAMPSIVRALLAVDADGLWLSPSIESGMPGSLSPSRRVAYESLYRGRYRPRPFDDPDVHRAAPACAPTGQQRWPIRQRDRNGRSDRGRQYLDPPSVPSAGSSELHRITPR